MQRRVPPAKRQVHGATLAVSTMGGYSVLKDGHYLGYLHASVGDRFHVYRRRANETDDYLGKFTQEDGVKAILRACGRLSEEASV